MKTTVLLFGVLLLAQIGFAGLGTPNFINYRVENGLPSSEVYDVVQDDHGYMWFATDRGLARFNGYDFTVFNIVVSLDSAIIIIQCR